MQNEVGYLFSGLSKGKGRGREKGDDDDERERQRQGLGEERRREVLFQRELERKEGAQFGSRRKICLPRWKGRGVSGACVLKGQDRPLHSHLFFFYNKKAGG